jgi:hypothetical protein
MITSIKTKTEKYGIYLVIESNDIIPTEREERICSYIDNKVLEKFIDQINAISVDCSRYNGETDIEIAKYFVESLLTEKEIRELIKQLEN